MSYLGPTLNKRIVACLCGQSNEAGSTQTPDSLTSVLFKANFGLPLADPIGPNGNATNGGSWWPILGEKLAVGNGIGLKVMNTAVGATGFWANWCGNDGSVALTEGDGGFDPNTYISTAYNSIANLPGFDEKWVFISTGQADSAVAGMTTAKFQSCLESIADYFLARSVKVVIGLSSYYPTEVAGTYANALKPGFTAALATYSGNSNVITGADLYTELTESVELHDTAHLTDRACRQAATLWYNALKGSI